MKSITRKFRILIITLTLIGANAVEASLSKEEGRTSMVNLAEDVTGAWEYTVENVPYEYSTGVLMISKENKEYKIKIQLDAGAMDAENVKVEDNKIYFTVVVEGSQVTVNLKVSGDTISGESSSYDGNFAIKGKRMQPE